MVCLVFIPIGLIVSISMREMNPNMLNCGLREKKSLRGIVLNFQKVLVERKCWLVLVRLERDEALKRVKKGCYGDKKRCACCFCC